MQQTETREFKLIKNFEDEKNVTWFKILLDDSNNFDGYVFRLTKENDYKFPRHIKSKYSEINKEIILRKFLERFKRICNNFSFRSDVTAVFPFCQIKWEGGDNTIKSCSVNHFPNCPEIIYNEIDNNFYTVTPNDNFKYERIGYNKKLTKMLKYRVIKIINVFDAQNYLTEEKEKNIGSNLDLFSREIIEKFGGSDDGGYKDRIKDSIVEYMNLQFSLASIIKDKRITVSGSGPLEYYIVNEDNTTISDINGEIVIYMKNFFKSTKGKKCLKIV